MKKKHLRMLKEINQTTKNDFKRILESVEDSYINFLSECVLNILEGVVKIDTVAFKKHEKQIKLIVDPTITLSRKRSIFSSVLGWKLAKLIAPPCIEFLTNNASGGIRTHTKEDVYGGVSYR